MALFPFIVMFVVTSVTTLRERRSGTLERILTLPTGTDDVIVVGVFLLGCLTVASLTLRRRTA